MKLIAENYRRMVIPQITALDIDSWTQIGRGGGMSKCYLTWDGDFKWGGFLSRRLESSYLSSHERTE